MAKIKKQEKNEENEKRMITRRIMMMIPTDAPTDSQSSEEEETTAKLRREVVAEKRKKEKAQKNEIIQKLQKLRNAVQPDQHRKTKKKKLPPDILERALEAALKKEHHLGSLPCQMQHTLSTNRSGETPWPSDMDGAQKVFLQNAAVE